MRGCDFLRKLSSVASKLLESFANLSTVVMAFVAVGAALVAYNQLEQSKEASAKGVYKDFLSMAFANPDFSAASYPLRNPRFNKILLDGDLNSHVEQCEKPKKCELYEKYENYVSFLLYSAEEILGLVSLKEKEGWCFTLRDQFKFHALYFSKRDWGREKYDKRVVKLIDSGVEIYQLEVETLSNSGRQEAKSRLRHLEESCDVD
ncbi:hypothetical protein [Pseudomonas taiwanensis]|uniref:hypothetical protein n=1 Tax=Pseudomonas taiwanensis TaxID=470150 RepID=UPI0012DF25AB|nr:hypothetical protein [Pseudomonas taiwanensis]